MKKSVYYYSIVACFLLASCQKDSLHEENNLTSFSERSAWLDAKLDTNFALQEQKNVTSYLFNPTKMAELITTKNVHHVRFVLGYEDKIIKINAVGVDNYGNELATVSSEVFFDASYDKKLQKLNTAIDRKQTSKTVVSKHILSFNSAFNYVQEWQNKLIRGNKIEETVTYNGVRVQYFVLESAVVNDMAMMKGATKIALFLGLNAEGKMTTVFAGLDTNNNLVLPSSTTTEGTTYDFSSPCPPYDDVARKPSN